MIYLQNTNQTDSPVLHLEAETALYYKWYLECYVVKSKGCYEMHIFYIL